MRADQRPRRHPHGLPAPARGGHLRRRLGRPQRLWRWYICFCLICCFSFFFIYFDFVEASGRGRDLRAGSCRAVAELQGVCGVRPICCGRKQYVACATCRHARALSTENREFQRSEEVVSTTRFADVRAAAITTTSSSFSFSFSSLLLLGRQWSWRRSSAPATPS